jgi:hypothetical protein
MALEAANAGFVRSHVGLRRMIDEIVSEQLFEDIEIAFALHLFGIPADDSLGGFAGCSIAHCRSPINGVAAGRTAMSPG